MEEVRTELVKTKLKLLEKVNEKLEDKNITTEDLKILSATLSNVITFSDYAEQIYNKGFGFGGCTTPSETNK